MMGAQRVFVAIDPSSASGPDQLAVQMVPPIAAIPSAPRSISPEAAVRIVATLMNVDRRDLVGRSRAQRLVEARALVVWILRAVPEVPMSYPAISRALDNRHHTSIMHLHLMAIRLRLESDLFARFCAAIALYFHLTQESSHVSR